ncbi:prephenate dehydrogenase [Paracoccus rhizosphaerae]|uniref:Prephenate dehydrogenase/arogenate dehydrogenase family protein n=1 Tax=Paracoccus rhizosphaerae TaxID=1133347 RepID=A0ABV6CDH5_9RHOB|nr:prephenate dehydrogenase [Paracoccus rhizosphaerae]
MSILPLPSVLIFGFGAFGRLVAEALAPHLPITVCDPAVAPDSTGYPVVGPEAAGDFDIVLLAVPVPALRLCLEQIAPHLRAGQVVVDVCSVKEGPASLMAALLPADVQILGTHPMFGPQSAAAGLAGARIVLCPLRGQQWRRIAAFMRHVLQMRIVIATPEEHDRHAALTQGLTHLLARAMGDLQPHPMIRTRSFDLIMEGLSMVRHDAPEVYEAVTGGNRHLVPLRVQLAQFLAGGA